MTIEALNDCNECVRAACVSALLQGCLTWYGLDFHPDCWCCLCSVSFSWLFSLHEFKQFNNPIIYMRIHMYIYIYNMNILYLDIVKSAPLHAKISLLWLWSSSECPRDVFCGDQVAVRAVWRSSQQVVLALAAWKLGVPKCDQTKWCTAKGMQDVPLYNDAYYAQFNVYNSYNTYVDNVFKR